MCVCDGVYMCAHTRTVACVQDRRQLVRVSRAFSTVRIPEVELKLSGLIGVLLCLLSPLYN